MQPPQNPYNQPPLPNPMGGGQPTPPGVTSATTLIITGVLGIICCGLLGIYTLVKSNEAIKVLSSGYGNVADISSYNIARILGIIGTVLWVLGLIIRIAGIGAGVSSYRTTGSAPVGIPANR